MGKFRSKLEEYVHKTLVGSGHGDFEVNGYPDWLINPLTSKRLQLDFYDRNRKVAIEVQGPTHQSCMNQMMRDAIKRRLCSLHGVDLMYVTNATKSKDIKRIIAHLNK